MRFLSTLCLTLLLGASGTAAMASSKASFAKKFKNVDIHRLVSVPGMVDCSNSAYQMRQAGLATVGNAPMRIGDTPTNAASGEAYGWVTSPDASNWYFTQDITSRDSVYSEDYTAHFHESSVITLFDNNHKQVGSFSVKVPEGWKHVTDITPYGPVTKKLFDRDENSNEILVEFHDAFKGSNKYLTRAYDINTGEIKFEMEGTGLVFDASKGWDSYQRLIMTHESDEKYSIDVIAPPANGQNKWTVEHTFNFAIDNRITYLQGSCFNCMNVDGTPYYVLAQYDKPFTNTDVDDGSKDVKQEPNNFLVLRTLDENFDKVDSIRVSIDAPEGIPYRSAAFGLFGNNDLSKGYFSNSGKLNYVVGLYDYVPSLDGDLISYAVYDSENGKLKDICDKVTSNKRGLLNTIHGKSEQMWFLQTIGTSEGSGQQIQLVDVPSCEKVGVLPQSIDGNAISSNFDRYPTTANAQGYQYVIALSQAQSNEAGEVLAPIAWVNPDRTIDHVDRLNLGLKAENFTPLINSTSLNPYLFNTDDDMEYVYIAKKRREDGSNKIDNVLEVSKLDGTVLKSWRGDDTHVFEKASFPVMNDLGKRQMFVVFNDTENNKYEMNFYDLPFTKFERGGKGTVEDPYLISTTGDFQQLALEPDKNYKMVADIDMSKAAQWWTPVKNFTGSLDGDGHTIYNLGVKTTEDHTGLFGTLDLNGVAKNLIFVNPTVEVTNTNQFAGVLAGETNYTYDGKGKATNVDSIFVYGAKIEGDDQTFIAAGGLVGSANLKTKINNCSFQGEITLPNSENVGGIVGQTRSGSSVNACYANVNATAKTVLGGIVGIAGTPHDYCKFTNCEVRGQLTAENAVGGFVGDNYFNEISNVVSHADIVATKKSAWNGYAAGGIIGVMESARKDDSGFAKNCVFDGSVKVLQDGEEINAPATVHQIAGKIIADDEYSAGETPAKETRLSGNYTTNNVGSTDATSVDGAYKAAKEMGKDFFTGMGYAYGSSLAEPWKEDGSKIPTLYFNNIAKAFAVSADDVTVGTTDEGAAVVKVSVYGLENPDLGSDLEVSSTPNAAVSLGETHGNSIDLIIKGKKQGAAVVTVNFGEFSATIHVTVLKNFVSGIESVEAAEALVIKAADGQISAEGANAIWVYSVNGKLVGKTSGAAFSTSGLTSGLYIVKATDKAGHKATAKFVIK
ncbi:T9SS type A sorting domain-containing protein [Segatella copri]|uniref:T9SS type A sorting domain-containing protein n=1 Tax=Segatella copri TaxID=165179 RepID=UPI0022317CD1|nr:T9SS type A sorting domain-containing protein [Segatella copri]MCW4112237.1 T9SS type A sorting domain-containing protein [Segatella copri]